MSVTAEEREELAQTLRELLAPLVRRIDRQALYPGEVLRELGRRGWYPRLEDGRSERLAKSLRVIEEAAVYCGSTAFLLWHQTSAILYCATTETRYLREEILPALSRGDLIGSSGLSNAMKYYAGMEPLRLKATPVDGGFRITGRLPFISNLGPDHWFAVIAENDQGGRVAFFLPTTATGLKLRECKKFLGLNGTGTFNLSFADVFAPDDWVLSRDADAFAQQVRAEFALNQAGIAVGCIRASLDLLAQVRDKQEGVNHYLKLQPEEIARRLEELAGRVTAIVQRAEERERPGEFRDVVKARLDGAYLALEATEAGMLHEGATAYLEQSSAARRLREVYFVALVTPAVKHLEKLLKETAA